MAPRCALLSLATLAALARPAAAQAPDLNDGHATVSAAPDDVARGQVRFRSFGTADGLRNLVVVSIAQDHSGLLWLATDDGAYRYDGQQMTHYGVRDGLPAMGVRVLGVAPDGALCAGTRDGLACWDGGRFTKAGTEGLPPVWIQALAAGPDSLWAGTSAGLYVRRGTGPFTRVPGLAPHETKAIWVDAEGVVIGDGEVLRIGDGRGAWREVGAEAGLAEERIDAVVRDRDGALWIRSVHHLWILRRGADRVEDWSAGLPSGSDLSGVTCGMVVAPWGDVLVGSDRGIAYRRGARWQLIDTSVGFPSREARTLFVDREGTVWIGALGLYQWMGRGLVSRHDPASGLPGDVVWSMARDQTGVLWAGTGQCLARIRDDRWACLPGTQLGSVRSFVLAPGGGTFFGGAPAELGYVDPTGAVRELALPGDGVADRHILALALGPDRALWIASTHGLFRLPGAVPGPIERVTVPGMRPEARFISLMTSGDELWTAGDEGLAVRGARGWQRFDRASGLRGTAMRYVIRRIDGRTCVTFTDIDGLTCFRYDGVDLRERHDLSVPDGLTSGRVYFIGEDRQARLWVGTGDGVDIVTPSGVDHLDETDGLVGNDSAARSFFEDLDGSVWLGASNGVSHVRAQYYRGPPDAPRTVLLGGTLGNKPISTAPGATAQAPHDLNSVNVSFAADGFLNPRRIEYQVRLSPLETEWSATRLREARYPALPPGGYRLELRARTGAGTWGPAAVLPLEILPAWWQTRWFYALVGLVALAALAGLVGVWQRALWRRRARQLHQRSDASFRELIESMPDIVTVYRERRLFYMNQAARELLGLTDDSWRGGQLIERLHPDDLALAADLFRGGGGAHNIELRMRGGDGSWRNCELSSRRIALGDGAVMVVSGRDVTERHRLRAKLVLSDRLVSLGTLAAGIAHEINNPLAYVTANLEVVAESLDEEVDGGEVHADRKAAIADAREGAERVRKIVRGLRSFSRYEEEKRVPLALPDVIDAAIRLTGNELRHRAVLVRDLAPTPLVLGDDGRLAQVLINLLVNAAHAIPEGHTDANEIVVRTHTDAQGRAVIEIEDTGRGMPPEVAARAFDPFFTTKAVGEGTGLGLSICHGIVTGLGGTIAIESGRERGSVVRVVLPAAPADTAVPEAVTAADHSAPIRRRHVLVVDDDPRVANAIKRMLSSDHELTLASCGAEAIDHVAAGVRFDAIVTDVMMPNMTGIELFDQLAAVAPDQAARVIFLSGGVFTPQTQARLEAAGNIQLQKPVSAQELRASVADVARAA
jgi:PAS domain S-box-containing protein